MLSLGNSKKALKAQFRKNDREIKKEIRGLAKDLKANEQKINQAKKDIRKQAEDGNTDKVRNVAKRIVRLQKHNDQIHKMTGNLEDLQMQMAEMKTMNAMSDAMRNMTKMMSKMAKYQNPQTAMKQLQKFQKAQMKNEMTQEMMSDVMEDMFDEDLEAEDELVDKVLEEVGVQITDGLASVPMQAKAQQQQEEESVPIPQGADDLDVNALETRLRNLNNNDI